jgi:hypothetical protein
MSEIKFKLGRREDCIKFTPAQNEPIVEIKPNGEVIVNPKYTVTEAARLFWNEFIKVNPINGWRRVDDELPENEKEVMVTLKIGFVDLALFSDGEFWIDKKIYTQDISAWMLKPEAFEG